MTLPSDKIAAAKARWGLVRAEPIVETATSWVFKTGGGPRSPAVLKVLKPYGSDEIEGAALLAWYRGEGAAELFGLHDGMMLMEWLDGELLGDMARAGRDREATDVLAAMMEQLHGPRPNPPQGLQTLDVRFQTLLRAAPSDWPASHRGDFERASEQARKMLATTAGVMPLHGDFHHDNVIHARRGWLAIDPKGLIGDPAYDIANVFRNPIGMGELAAKPARIAELAHVFAERLRLDRRRILAWAAAHAALSACWDREAGNPTDFNLTMLPPLLAAVEQND